MRTNRLPDFKNIPPPPPPTQEDKIKSLLEVAFLAGMLYSMDERGNQPDFGKWYGNMREQALK